MASLVGRVLDREGIENRKAYLQLFFCQRSPQFVDWWRRLEVGERREVLLQCGVPLRATPAAERLAAFPEAFNVETLLERADGGDYAAEASGPLLFGPFDGAVRTLSIVADPLTEWAPRVSDEAFDWLQTLTTIVAALVDAYQDATEVYAAQPVWTAAEAADVVADAWTPPEWAACRALLRARFFPDEAVAPVAVPPTRSVRAHREAAAAAARRDAVKALECAEELGVEDDDDLRMVARAMGLLADGLAWSGHLEALSPEDGDAVCFGNDLCHDRRLDLVRRLPRLFLSPVSFHTTPG